MVRRSRFLQRRFSNNSYSSVEDGNNNDDDDVISDVESDIFTVSDDINTITGMIEDRNKNKQPPIIPPAQLSINSLHRNNTNTTNNNLNRNVINNNNNNNNNNHNNHYDHYDTDDQNTYNQDVITIEGTKTFASTTVANSSSEPPGESTAEKHNNSPPPPPTSVTLTSNKKNYNTSVRKDRSNSSASTPNGNSNTTGTGSYPVGVYSTYQLEHTTIANTTTGYLTSINNNTTSLTMNTTNDTDDDYIINNNSKDINGKVGGTNNNNNNNDNNNSSSFNNSTSAELITNKEKVVVPYNNGQSNMVINGISNNTDGTGVQQQSSSKNETPTENANNNNDNDNKSEEDDATTMPIIPSPWKQKIIGIRADRLIVLLLLILIMSISVIVAALILVSKQDNDNTNTNNNEVASTASTTNDRSQTNNNNNTNNNNDFSFGPEYLPTISPTSVPSVSPSKKIIISQECRIEDDMNVTFPSQDNKGRNNNNNNNNKINCQWLSELNIPQKDKICQKGNVAYEFCPITCNNPCGNIIWPCEKDNINITSFFAGPTLGFFTDCLWLQKATLEEQNIVCTESNEAYNLCKETCKNCDVTEIIQQPTPTTLAPTVITDAITPTISPTTKNIFLPDESTSPTIIPIMTQQPSQIPSETPTIITSTETPTTQSPTQSATTIMPTTIPTVQVTTERPINTTTLFEVIITASPDSSFEIVTLETPQNLAFVWLQDSIDNEENNENDISNDRLIKIWSLATFAYSTDINNWQQTGSWLISGSDECQWYGITCDDNGLVVEINLSGNRLRGTIPIEISLFANTLEVLDISDNRLTGTLPTSIGELTTLTVFNMAENEFEGVIPDSIGGMINLQLWYLERNINIIGAFPDSVTELINLQELILWYTRIDYIIDDICTMNLDILTFDCVQITNIDCWTRCLYLCGGDTGVPCD